MSQSPRSTQGSTSQRSGKGKGGGGLIWADQDAPAIPDSYSGQLQGLQSDAGTGITEVAEAAMEDGYHDPLDEDEDIFGDEAPEGARGDQGIAAPAEAHAEAQPRVIPSVTGDTFA